MALNVSKGNMYEWIDKTVNPLAGECSHKCGYCYVENSKNRLKSHKIKYSGPTRISENGLKQISGKNKIIFVVSMNDLFADNVPIEDILKILRKCNLYYNNRYLFQTKNPGRLLKFYSFMPTRSIICTTIETNRHYKTIMNNSPTPLIRSIGMALLDNFDKYVTIEPIMDFDLSPLIEMVKNCNPIQVNIGADSKGKNIPEPSKEKTLKLISELKKFTKVHLKKNLNRIIK